MVTNDRWAEQMQQEVYEYWNENHGEWDHGVKIFYGPVDESSEILILGYQPGGKASSFPPDQERFEAGDFSVPDEHEYVYTDWDIAREMRSLFGENRELLAQSVKSNVNFFRAPDMDYWKYKFPKGKRSEAESYCLNHIDTMIDRLNPSVIICEGISTWDNLKNHRQFTSENCEYRGQSRLVCTSQDCEPKVIGLMHPSGARISREDKQRIRENLLNTLENHTSYQVDQ